MSFEVEAIDNVLDVEINSEIEVTASSEPSDVEVVQEIIVQAEIQEWVLTSDDIYIVNKYNEIPQWLEDQINTIVSDPDGLIINDINDLQRQIDALDEGFTNEIYRIDNVNYTQTVDFESLKSSYEGTAAAVVRIDSTYASKDYAESIAYEMVGAYLADGSAGAWFEQSISTVADVAYSAARSASHLNASIDSTLSYAEQIAGDVDILKAQVDGVVTTWFVDEVDESVGPLLPDGTINPACKPYYCWLEGNDCSTDPTYDDDDLTDTRAIHTGDTFVYFRTVSGDKEIIATYRFGIDPDTGVYNWILFADDLATEAYNTALAAQETADGKINTYYGADDPALTPGVVLGIGDLWFDSDGFAVEGNLTPPFNNAGVLLRYNEPGQWGEITDARITASVSRLDEATVNVDGVATAKGSLIVEATGGTGELAVSGYQATATSGLEGAVSEFRIFADKFVLASELGESPTYAPFTVDTTVSPSAIKFNGVVDFTVPGNEIPPPDLSAYPTFQDLSDPTSSTTITGNHITTGVIDASHVTVTNLDARSIRAGKIYNTTATRDINGNSTDYTMKVDLDLGEIHIR